MAVPNLSLAEIEEIIPSCKIVGEPVRGGQKVVYQCVIDEVTYAIKFILLSNIGDEDESDNDSHSIIEEAKARVEREISIMKQCDSPHLVKIGTIDLSSVSYKGQNLIFYTEEWINGKNITTLLKEKGNLEIKEVIKLGIDIARAIEKLWANNNVHRDIKPQNIMQKDSDIEFVLLDLGMAFDLNEKSLTKYGLIPGTKMYFSPEQLDYKRKRDIDFRSDLFCLGLVMYQGVTGKHPFYQSGMTDYELFDRILRCDPIAPQGINPHVPKQVSDIILRLLNKSPNERFRKCSILINQLETLQNAVEV